MDLAIYQQFRRKIAKLVPDVRTYEPKKGEIENELQKVMGSTELMPVYDFLCSPEMEFRWTFQSICIFDIRQLSDRQIGFRLVRSKNGELVLNDGWPDSCYAIGAHVTDPIIVDLSNKSYPISRGVTGTGEFKPLTKSIDDYFTTLNIWLDIVVEKYSGEFYDIDGEVNQSVLAELKSAASPYLLEGAFIEWLNE